MSEYERGGGERVGHSARSASTSQSSRAPTPSELARDARCSAERDAAGLEQAIAALRAMRDPRAWSELRTGLDQSVERARISARRAAQQSACSDDDRAAIERAMLQIEQLAASLLSMVKSCAFETWTETTKRDSQSTRSLQRRTAIIAMWFRVIVSTRRKAKKAAP
jgi:hypothetical protein